MSDIPTAPKTNSGNFFEDFSLGQRLRHATPRTVTQGDVALYTALTGSRFALQSSDEFARALGMERAPVDDLLVFHMVFGKSVPDISLNAVANLGYANGRFGVPVFAGDTVSTVSEVVGLKENSSGKTGVVYVNSVGRNQRGESVLDFIRWVMVNKRDASAPAPEPHVPDLPDAVDPDAMEVPGALGFAAYDDGLSGSASRWEDYAPGERIDHAVGVTIEDAEHMMATRLYQNTAKVHFNQHTAAQSRFGKRIVYGGHIISLARALSFNGLANGCKLLAINGGRHVAPSFAGDTIYAWSEVLDRRALAGRQDAGALRLRTIAAKDKDCAGFPGRNSEGTFDPAVVLEFDYWVLMPRR